MPTMPKCRKDGTEVYTCPACHNKSAHGLLGKLNCNTCKNTGHLCRTHGAYWQ